MDQHDNSPGEIHRTSEDKLSRPRLRGPLLHPDERHAGSPLTDSSPSRFGGMRLGIEESVVGLLIYFPLLALLRWVFGRPGHYIPAPLGDKANKSPGDYVAVKYAAITTIREDLRTATRPREKRREEAIVSASSSDRGAGGDIEAGASAPISPRPRSPLPPLSIDEVLQRSVWGFREKWWPISSTAAFEAARIEEAEGNVGGIGGFDMNPETKAFLDKCVYSCPLCISISISRTCPAVGENICYLSSPSAVDAVYPHPSSTSTPPPSIRSACPAVKEHTCLVPSPSVANYAGPSFSSAAERTTGRARADMTENDVAGSILAGAELAPAVVSSTLVPVGPKPFETLSIGEEETGRFLSMVESSLPLSQRFAGMEAISLDLPDGMTGGQLETSESGYDGDDDDSHDDDHRSGSLSIKGVFLRSSGQQEEEETEEMGEDEQEEEEDMEAISRADRVIREKLSTIGSDDDNDDNHVRYIGSNRFAVLFESSDSEEEQEDDGMESIVLADKAMEEKLTTIGSDDGNDSNDSNDARYVSNNQFAVLFESTDEEEEEEAQAERQEEEGEWGEKWGEEWNEEEDEEVEEEEPKEEMEVRQMEMEDDEAQDMQEKWREIDEEWEAMGEWVEDKEEEDDEGEQESVDN